MPLWVRPFRVFPTTILWPLQDEATGAVGLRPGRGRARHRRGGGAGGRLDLILLTHHHGDHIAGVGELKAASAAGGRRRADAHRLPPLDLVVREGDTVLLGESRAGVIDTPGHTRGHVAFHFAEGAVLLCGDILFSLGCGRSLEGTADEMSGCSRALTRLPGETPLCCGHEYTENNARFALSVGRRQRGASRDGRGGGRAPARTASRRADHAWRGSARPTRSSARRTWRVRGAAVGQG